LYLVSFTLNPDQQQKDSKTFYTNKNQLEDSKIIGLKIQGGDTQVYANALGGQGFQEKFAGGSLFWVLLHFYSYVFWNMPGRGVLCLHPLFPPECIFAKDTPLILKESNDQTSIILF
jgi:hypothetical protein